MEYVSPEEASIHEEMRLSIELLEKTVKHIRKRVQDQTDRDLKKLPMTIPGIGETIAATLIAEIETVE